MLDLNRLPTLKEKIITATDFKDPWEYFFTNFAEVPGFIELGNEADISHLQLILGHIASMLLKKDATVTSSMLKEIPGYSFIHGALILQEQIANIIYFSDVDMGIFAMLKPGSFSEFTLVRFSCATVGGKGKKGPVLH